MPFLFRLWYPSRDLRRWHHDHWTRCWYPLDQRTFEGRIQVYRLWIMSRYFGNATPSLQWWITTAQSRRIHPKTPHWLLWGKDSNVQDNSLTFTKRLRLWPNSFYSPIFKRKWRLQEPHWWASVGIGNDKTRHYLYHFKTVTIREISLSTTLWCCFESAQILGTHEDLWNRFQEAIQPYTSCIYRCWLGRLFDNWKVF